VRPKTYFPKSCNLFQNFTNLSLPFQSISKIIRFLQIAPTISKYFGGLAGVSASRKNHENTSDFSQIALNLLREFEKGVLV